MYKFAVNTIHAGMAAKLKVQIAASLLSALFLPALFGQLMSAQAMPAPSSQTPTIVTDVEEVTLDLVVRDKKNKSVLDLKPADLNLEDNGAVVKLSALRLVTGASSGEHLVTLVFDQLNPSAAKNAQDMAAKVFKVVADDRFSFAVLGVSGRLKLFQEFTKDRLALGRAASVVTEEVRSVSVKDAAGPEQRLITVAKTGTDLNGVTVSVNEREIARTMVAALEDSQRIVQEQRTQPSLAGLLALAKAERQIAGRKVIIYFAQGLQLNSNSNEMLRSIIGAANRSGVSIYAIDANALSQQASQGLMATIAIGGVKTANATSPVAPISSGAPTSSGIQPLPQLPPGLQAQIQDTYNRFEFGNTSNEPLGQLAESTGGVYIRAGDNLKKPLQRLVEDMTTYYEASYVPAIKEYDGQFRSVDVKPLRKGLKVRSRAGYFALPPGNSSGMRPFEAPLMKALSGTELPADIKFRAEVLRLGDLPDGNANILAIEVPLSALEMRQDVNTNLFSTHISVVAQIKNKAGVVVEHFSEDIPRHGALDAMETAKLEVVTLQRHFLAEPGQYTLETAIVDRNDGKIGAQRVDFEIPNNRALALSDLTLVRRIDPFNTESDPLEPLRYENGRIVPDLSGQVAPETKRISLFFMVHPDVHMSAQAQLEMEVRRDGEPVGRTPLQLRKASGDGVIPYFASIQSGSLPAGKYEVAAILTQGDLTTERSVSFNIGGAELASAAAGAKSASPAGSSESDTEVSSADADLQSSGVGSHQGRHLVITAALPGTVPPPSQDEFQAIVADVTKRAIRYSDSLPNFMCVEMTDRSVDVSGNGKWKHKDSIAELLRYHDNSETRVTLEVNGKASTTKRVDLRGTNGTLSEGEFGGVLKSVFQPSSKAEFHWKETDSIGSETVQVLSYRVARENSTWGLSGNNNWKLYPTFRGLLYVDSATHSIRRITLEADDLPRDFSIHAATMAVDYDYIAIGAHDYLMPIRGTVNLRQGKREVVLNEIEFRNYKRYGSKVKMVYSGQQVH